MHCQSLCCARSVRLSLSRWVVCGAALALITLVANTARGDDVVQIEEDWQLVVATPDPDNFAPQVTSTMSPGGGLDSFYAVLDLNLRNLPSYEAGGVQLQLWNGSAPVTAVRSNTGTLLQNQDETVTWTQRMTLSGGQLTFALVNGNSQTWGTFGNGSSMKVGGASNLTNLNTYDPSDSVANSGIGYASNRVTSLTLVKVRAYTAAGLAAQDTSPKVIYPR